MTTQEIIDDLRAWIPLSPTLNEFINRAADRLEELQLELTETREELDHERMQVKNLRDSGVLALHERDKAIERAEKAYKLRKESEIERDSLRDTMALDILELTKQRDELQRLNESMQIDRDMWIKVGREKLEVTKGERDEARAEVERLTMEFAAANSEIEKLNKELEQAISERTPHDYGILAEQRDEYRRMFYDAVKSLDKERAEAQRLKAELEKETIEKAIINQQLTVRPKPSRLEIAAMFAVAAMIDQQLTVRPEPSRLEIAAMFAVAAMIAKGRLTDHADSALLEADALIAAAKEVAK
jgi:chromosome segregation ATPase